jgi:S-disulfanyl-L-cysteine oxidoreductase SoxD
VLASIWQVLASVTCGVKVEVDMKKTVGVVLVGGFLVTAAFSTPTAQSGRTAKDGVYTEEQAKAGEQIYFEQCATCHGDALEGMGPMPPLAGDDFLINWRDRTLADLFMKNHETMPATAPGTMTPEQAAAVTAYMLQASNFPAGKMALDSQAEPLRQITLGTPPQ